MLTFQIGYLRFLEKQYKTFFANLRPRFGTKTMEVEIEIISLELSFILTFLELFNFCCDTI